MSSAACTAASRTSSVVAAAISAPPTAVSLFSLFTDRSALATSAVRAQMPPGVKAKPGTSDDKSSPREPVVTVDVMKTPR
jgi:hypothetical protein